MSLGLLEQCEQEIADALAADPFFGSNSDITIHSDPQKDPVAEVSHKIAQLRFLVAPLVDGAGCKNPDDPGPVFEPITIAVGVFGNPTIKLKPGYSGPTERKIAEMVHSILHLFKPASVSSPLYSAPNAIERVPNKGLNIFNCSFLTQGQLTYQMPQAATPTAGTAVVGPNTTVTLACATAGAALFYSITGNQPTPRSGTLYTAPVSVPNGTKVKARAWLAGYLTSQALSVQT